MMEHEEWDVRRGRRVLEITNEAARKLSADIHMSAGMEIQVSRWVDAIVPTIPTRRSCCAEVLVTGGKLVRAAKPGRNVGGQVVVHLAQGAAAPREPVRCP